MRLPEYEEVVKVLAARSSLDHLSKAVVYVVSTNSKSKAYARIWGVPRPLQEALGVGPAYVIELLPDFWALSCRDKVRVLAHELAHIPRTLSGSVRPHNKAFWRDYKSINARADGVCGLISSLSDGGKA